MTGLEYCPTVQCLVLPVVSAASSFNRELFAASRDVIEPQILRHIPIGRIEGHGVVAHGHAVRAVVVRVRSEYQRHFNRTAETFHWWSFQAQTEISIGGTGIDSRVLLKVESYGQRNVSFILKN